MTELQKPGRPPGKPFFSSGPCAKRPGWTPAALGDAAIGRSHRSKLGKAKLKTWLDRTRALLGVPADYRIAIVPASDTGAVEMAMWSLLGHRPVNVLAWESFGEGWVTDAVKQLKLRRTAIKADYGALPDLTKVDFAHDVIFTWNGTTSGVRVPNGDFIPDDREGLTICDATSAAFAQALAFDKLDVVTFSWQKVLGGEAAHGMLILSPRAVERLETSTPPWPMPKLFRMTKGGKLIEGIFEGETINTPSMLGVEDYLDALKWAKASAARACARAPTRNFAVLADWVAKTPWVDFLADDPAARSNTSVCSRSWRPPSPSSEPERRPPSPRPLVALDEERRLRHRLLSRCPAAFAHLGGRHDRGAGRRALTEWLDWAFAVEKPSPNKRPETSLAREAISTRWVRAAGPAQRSPTYPSDFAYAPAKVPGAAAKERLRMTARVLVSDNCPRPPSRSSRCAASRSTTCPTSARTRRSCSPPIGDMTGSPSAPPPR